MAHFAGLVAAGLHPSPVPYSDVVSSTVHKTIGGPRSGFILSKAQWAKKIDSAVFPGQQGGPLMHVVAAKAVAFKIAGTDEFRDRQQRTLDGAKILAERLTAPDVKAAGVDVLTGGASATYGADAVAGVVNFVMDTDFTGFRIDTNYGVYNHKNRNTVTPSLLDARQAAGFNGFGYPKGSVTDGGQFDTTVAFGTGLGDKGHATAYFGYRKVNPVLQSNRDYSACTLQARGSSNLQCGGSLTNSKGTAIYFTPTYTSSDPANLHTTSTIGLLGPGVLERGNVNRYNFAPLNYFQRPDERYTAGVFADYEISEAIHPYMEFMFMDDRTLAQIAPSGDFGNTLTTNCDNPLMSASQASQICNPNNLITGNIGGFPTAAGAAYNPSAPTGVITGPDAGGTYTLTVTPTAAPQTFFDPNTGLPYNTAFLQLLRRNVEGGPRISDLQHTAYRAVLGVKGDLGKAWSYDAYYQYGRTNYSQVYTGEFSTARLTQALDAVLAPAGYTGSNFVTDASGNKVICRSSYSGGNATCVPYNIFGAVDPRAIQYVSASGLLKGMTSEQVASANLTGNLGEYGIKMPWASDGVGVALGTEWRRESLDLQADNEFSTGDLTGQGAPTKDTSGSYTVSEVFGEIQIPIVQDTLFHDLSFNGGYRYSHYKTNSDLYGSRTFNTDTFKLGLEFAPVSDIRFRAGYNRAVRVPNIQELFAPKIVALDGTSDPCAGGGTLPAGCASQGVTGGTTGNPAGQYNGQIGGNPDLNPEKATTKTLGVVLTPRMIPGLSLSADWLDIKVKNAIQQIGADAIVNYCSTNFVAECGDLIHRNPAGSLWLTPDGYVVDYNLNIGSVQTRGVEFNGSYSKQIGNAGKLSLSFVGTMLDKYRVDNGLTEPYDCAGYYGPTCQNPLPKWRHKARASFDMKNGIGVSLQWRYIGPVQVEYLNSSSTLNSSTIYDQDARIKAQSYFDLTFTYDLGDHLSWRLGAQNLFDKQPPLVTSGSSAGTNSACASVYCNGNTYPGTYDALGRYIFTGVTLNF
jgi:outer membrane receptor protein involved in Fe transport